ncbi:hypothetical protein [Streptomyces sp. DSM 118148]|uniref:hypothetical protein n=1 Tax=Streptomyces sp. DSM 118148 TaxID=3448667 RepID=UPI0040401F16
MAIDYRAILNEVVSHAAESGFFNNVNSHEPIRSHPGSGLTASVWLDSITPIRSSGLATTSVLVVLTVRMYRSTVASPLDDMDAVLADAVSALMDAYQDDFTLGGLVRHVDVFGAYGTPLGVKGGYIQQLESEYRVLDLKLPLVINDVADQAA